MEDNIKSLILNNNIVKFINIVYTEQTHILYGVYLYNDRKGNWFSKLSYSEFNDWLKKNGFINQCPYRYSQQTQLKSLRQELKDNNSMCDYNDIMDIS